MPLAAPGFAYVTKNCVSARGCKPFFRLQVPRRSCRSKATSPSRPSPPLPSTTTKCRSQHGAPTARGVAGTTAACNQEGWGLCGETENASLLQELRDPPALVELEEGGCRVPSARLPMRCSLAGDPTIECRRGRYYDVDPLLTVTEVATKTAVTAMVAADATLKLPHLACAWPNNKHHRNQHVFVGGVC